jgi:hypothetical protein
MSSPSGPLSGHGPGAAGELASKRAVSSPGERRKSAARLLLLAGGLALVAYLVVDAGPRQVLDAIVRAGPWLPVLIALEAAILAVDTVAFAAVLGASARSISARAWVRSSALSFVCLVLLPAGRTASEVVRASTVSRFTGALRSASAAVEMQAASLVADGIISGLLALGVAVRLGGRQHLAALLAGNLVLAGALGGGLFVLLHHPRIAAALRGRFPRLAGPGGEPGSGGLAATAWSVLGRALQALQYGVAVLAVGGAFGARGALVADGVHMIGATIGMPVPNQIGVADGAYVAFADVLGFGDAPARALAVALVVRAAQLGLGVVGLLVATWARERPALALSPEPRV